MLATSRVVTVSGLGGVGKTRTALRAATEAARDFPDGVCLVELSGIRDTRLLVHAVAHAVGLQDQTARPPIDALTAFLSDRRLLLVLDTCEHMVDGVAMLIELLLADCPGVRFLVTSRRPLEVAGEQVFAVPPMSVPDPDAPHDDDARCDSVVLFTERAAAADSAFALTAGNRDAVMRLCRRLDGLPLALELAAVWLLVMPVAQVVRQLDQRLDLLSGGSGAGSRRQEQAYETLPHDTRRHETLRAAIGWSHELCDPLERLLWARMSVFAGPVDAATVQSVCADGRLPCDEIPALLDGLADKSVLLREPGAPVRYRLLDTLREYGEEWLKILGVHRAFHRRHRDHYLVLARRCAASWCGPGQVEWCHRMNAVHADLRAALDFSLSEPEEHGAALRMASDLYFFWVTSGMIPEGRHYLDRVLAVDPPAGPGLTKALRECARIATAQGDLATASGLLERCRPFAVEQGDVTTRAHIAYLSGSIAMLKGEHERSVELLEEAARLHEEDGEDGMGLLLTLAMQGMVRAMRGEGDRAVALLEECRERCDGYGERWVRSVADYMRGLAELSRGDVTAAVWYGQESLRFKERLPDRLSSALALDLLAAATAAAGDGDRAARLLGFSDRLWHSFGLPQLGSPELSARRRQCEVKVREMLGEDVYQSAFRDGGKLDFTSGVGFALDAGPSGPGGS
ncbi:LuxR family transcriptional regulator [Spirillospora sp. NPDC047279]|uniref:ATP-binding protein n=1 Tax=Spirillospora sp. NPDC047279 TaxID=3155478 RepID=UPI0033F25B91